MAVTIDNIAQVLIDWCAEKAPEIRNAVVDDEILKDRLLVYFKNKMQYEVLKEAPVYKSHDPVDFVFNALADNPSDKIIAELNVENSDGISFEKEVIRDIVKLSTIDNIKDDYKYAAKCVISLYYNRCNRTQLHEKQFIEIYNDFEIGCALKRVNR